MKLTFLWSPVRLSHYIKYIFKMHLLSIESERTTPRFPVPIFVVCRTPEKAYHRSSQTREHLCHQSDRALDSRRHDTLRERKYHKEIPKTENMRSRNWINLHPGQWMCFGSTRDWDYIAPVIGPQVESSSYSKSANTSRLRRDHSHDDNRDQWPRDQAIARAQTLASRYCRAKQWYSEMLILIPFNRYYMEEVPSFHETRSQNPSWRWDDQTKMIGSSERKERLPTSTTLQIQSSQISCKHSQTERDARHVLTKIEKKQASMIQSL